MLFDVLEIYAADIPGLGEVKLDPLGLRRGLIMATHGRCWEWSQTARDIERDLTAIPDTDTGEVADAKRAELSLRLADVEGKLAQAAYDVFPIVPVDLNTGQGTTETAAMLLLQNYLRWVEEKKASAGASPTS